MIDQKKLIQLKKYFAAQPVDGVYLFGSQATDKTNKLSDVDLAVLFKKGLSESKRFDLRLEMIGDACGILKTDRVDVVDLERAPVALRHSAIFPRREIYIANNKRRVLFEAETNSRYFDQNYFIRQNTLSSLASIARMS